MQSPPMNGATEETDLYKVLGVSKGASGAEIRTAYKKKALSSHPDKVPEEERAEAEIRFKGVSQAYDILSDDEKRHLYDTHGMAAFEKGAGGMGAEMDMDDILQQMFGMGMGGMPGMGGGRGGPKGPRRGPDEEQEYEVTLEELYKGKTTKFASTKNVICGVCKGSGGKEGAKAKQCDDCKGKGSATRLQQIGPGLVTQVTVPCPTCGGNGQFFKDKDRCKKCKGNRVVQEKKFLELYIPPGAREGERIVLAGEADQRPGQEPGDIIFQLTETPHETFRRAGPDLAANLEITLAEALSGFNRTVLTHLDGRGIQLNVTQPEGRVLRPEQVLRVPGEGMPVKRSDDKGDLYLIVKITFPKDGWLKDPNAVGTLRELLPGPEPPIEAQVVDEVEFEDDVNLEDFGAGSGDPRGGAEWEDDEIDGDQPQCGQQ